MWRTTDILKTNRQQLLNVSSFCLCVCVCFFLSTFLLSDKQQPGQYIAFNILQVVPMTLPTMAHSNIVNVGISMCIPVVRHPGP